MKVIIDGINYRPETEQEAKFDAEVKSLLSNIWGDLWIETFYDPHNETTRKFAAPLCEKMAKLNSLLKFKE